MSVIPPGLAGLADFFGSADTVNMADFLSIVVVLFLRISGAGLAIWAIFGAFFAMWFRIEGSDEIRTIQQVDLLLGALLAAALLLFFAPDCYWKPKAWVYAFIGAVIVWTCTSGLLMWWHWEQDQFRASISVPE